MKSTPTTDKWGATHWRDEAGELHRTDGPAYESAGGYRLWYLHGEQMTEAEHARRTGRPVERIGFMPRHVSPPADGIVYGTVDRQCFRVRCGDYTGADIRSWTDPPIGANSDLWHVRPGYPDDLVADDDVVTFDRSGFRFYTGPRFINASDDRTAPPEPPHEHDWRYVHARMQAEGNVTTWVCAFCPASTSTVAPRPEP